MPLVISDELLRAAGMTARDAKIEITCRLFDAGTLAFGKAAQLADLTEVELESQLDARGLPRYRYTDQKLEDDVAALKKVGRW